MPPYGWRPARRAPSRSGPARSTGTEHTFTISGHHYAVVVLTGLEPGSSTPYEVLLDGDRVWPLKGSAHPPSRIRTLAPGRPVRLLFGSCREPPTTGRRRGPRLDPDVLDAYAVRMASQAHEEWPDALFMAGDQVYADETSAAVQAFIRGRRDVSRAPGLEVADFEEYTRLYYESWSDPNIRWLLSTLAQLDDLRRSRRPGRLEHVARLAR